METYEGNVVLVQRLGESIDSVIAEYYTVSNDHCNLEDVLEKYELCKVRITIEILE